ncbi:MAG: TetR/AcrR family transcriptional regulator [Microbacterium sp.]|nr:TetR/AcrR family transcriptional regulator [Microbacterium sp.]MBN9153709.1 TetR/AcrR family transcriptional regulator [Microbacterium sp.]MBN9173462.1 TetR/AcrR family transcriptional regulator [Microbacterium sp.]
MDPRVARTRRSLQEALLALARERSLDDLTIGDIAEHAGVNRSSFYQHYSDKETLLADALETAIDDVARDFEPSAVDIGEMPAELFAYLDHIDHNAALYRRILGDRGSAVVAARLRERIELIVAGAVDAAEVATFRDVPTDVVAAGIAGTALGVITAWVSRDERPDVTVAAGWMWRMLLGPRDEASEHATDPGRRASSSAPRAG